MVGLGCYKWYQSQTSGNVSARRLSPEGGWTINLEGKLERESPKMTISISGGLGPLQMVSEPDTEQCISEEAEL